ncbi:hypothetical protein MHK_004951, partial [Candidatus Magnetomorum sp. HK-1]
RNEQYETDVFINKFKKLKTILGEIDQDIILLKMDIARRKAQKR